MRTLLPHTLLFCVALSAAMTARSASVPEHEVKLALTYKVAKFVGWPSAPAPAPTFVLCVLGDNPFGDALAGIAGRPVQDRPIEIVLEGMAASSGAPCDLLFVSRSEGERVEAILEPLRNAPVLTVSDTPGFAQRGGIVELQNRGGRIGFEINVAAYRRAGLTISSQLLELATLFDETRDREP